LPYHAAAPCRPSRFSIATVEYTYQGSVANRALEFLGKEIGMFTERREDDVAVSLGMAVDVPPEE